MKPTCTDMALRAVVGKETELRFFSERNLPLNSFQTRIRLFFVLLTKIADAHSRDLLSVTALTLLKCMPLAWIFHELLSRDHEDGCATWQPQGDGSEAYASPLRIAQSAKGIG